MSKAFLVSFLSWAVTVGSSAACLNYVNFNSTEGLTLTGVAASTNGLLRLTPAQDSQTGDAWINGKQPCAGGFDTTFHFRITTLGNIYGNEPGGDGFTFSVQNVGPADVSWATGGSNNYVSVFFNTFWNWPGCTCPDMSDNSVGILVNQTYVAQTDLNPLGIQMSDGAVHQARIRFDGAGMSVWVDGVSVLTNVPLAGLQPGVDNAGQGWVGFTAGTGAAYENHDILDWSFCLTNTPPVCTPAPSGLIGLWRAEGDTLDSVGSGNGVAVNVGYTSGIHGQAFAFDPENYPYGTYTGVQIPDQSAYVLTNSLSIEGWIRPRGDSYIIFWRGDHRPGLDPYALSMQGNHTLLFQISDENGNGASVGATLDYSQWYHVAATLDGVSGTMSIYTNGTLAGQTVTAIRPFGALIAGDSPGVGIGNLNDGGNNFPFIGDVDEISLYNRALNSSEVQAIYNTGSAGKCPLSPPPPPPIVPIITSFAPASSAPGSIVEIHGTNFSAIASNNVVYFGAVRATVLNATPSLLAVNVPSGATYAPITVMVNGLVAYSGTSFQPTFAGSGANIDPSSLAPRFDLAGGDGAHRSAIADLDGDGKPDLAVADVYGHTISLFRNIGAPGSLGPGSFSPRVELPAEGGASDNPYGFTTADVDGDGKLDLVACDRIGNHISVYRNIASPGDLSSNSFAPRVNFAVGADPRYARVADLDGDGRPDIVSCNYAVNTISILRNVGVAGSLDADSFAPKVDLPAGTGVYDVAIADLDGDGKLDLAAVNQDGFSISIFRNISSPGLITSNSFEPRVDLPAPNGNDTIVAGDIDGDGKPDLAIGSYLSGSMSVYRNLSTAGSLTAGSFAPRVDFSTGNWTHTVALGDLNGDGKPDIAAVGELDSYLSLFQNLSTPGSFTNASLGGRVDFGAGWNAWGVSVGDLDADGRPDIVFCNAYDDTVSIYRNLIAVTNTPPPCVAAPSGLVSWWQGESNALDSVDSNNGTLMNGAGFGPGKVGQAFSFDGVDDYLKIPQSANLNPGNQVTVEFWMKSDPGNPMNTCCQGLVSSDFYHMEISSSGGPVGVNFVISTDNGGSYPDTSQANGGSAVISAGAWHHVAGTYDGTKLQLYVDGAPWGNPLLHTGAISPMLPNSFVSIGSEAGRSVCGGCPGRNFKGLIDEVGIYSRALSAAEIAALYNAGSAGKCPTNAPPPPPPCVAAPSGLVSWWQGESNALDSVDSNNGTLMNGAGFGPGKVGQAFSFDGVNDFVKIPQASNLNVGNQVTIEFWMKADPTNAMNTYQGLVTSDFYAIEIANGFTAGPMGVLFFISTDGGASVSPSSFPNTADANGGGAVISAGAWHHIAGTYDGTKLQLYIDGAPWGNPMLHTGSISPMLANSFVTIGAEDGRTIWPQFIGPRYFSGLIDEPSIYNRALSAPEIKALFDAGSAGKCSLLTPPFVVSQPTNQTVYVGQTATFTVLAGGSPPLQYQWLFKGVPLDNQTNAALTIVNAQFTDAGNYSVVVSNAANAITSSNALLTVNPIPPCTPPPDGLISWWRFENSLLDNWDSNNGIAPVNQWKFVWR